jgi:hypothetical protein
MSGRTKALVFVAAIGDSKTAIANTAICIRKRLTATPSGKGLVLGCVPVL